jgi:hypothetical protein
MKALAVASTVAAFSGCQSVEIKQPFGRPIPAEALSTLAVAPACRPIYCRVDIEVVGDCTFKANPMVLVFYGGPAHAQTRAATFEIRDPNYRFASNPFDPKGSSSFFGVPVAVGPRGLLVPVTIANQGDTHEYGLTIQKSDGTMCSKYDPWMVE